MGNNFGLFGSFEKARRLLKKLYRITSENALIIADTRDIYKTDNPAHLEYHRINKEKGRMGGQVRIRIRFRKHVGRWFDYLMVSKEEMKEILDGTGWKIKEFIGSGNSDYLAIIEKMAESTLNLDCAASETVPSNVVSQIIKTESADGNDQT